MRNGTIDESVRVRNHLKPARTVPLGWTIKSDQETGASHHFLHKEGGEPFDP